MCFIIAILLLVIIEFIYNRIGVCGFTNAYLYLIFKKYLKGNPMPLFKILTQHSWLFTLILGYKPDILNIMRLISNCRCFKTLTKQQIMDFAIFVLRIKHITPDSADDQFFVTEFIDYIENWWGKLEKEDKKRLKSIIKTKEGVEAW